MNKRIIFFGTAYFAVASLDTLLKNKFNIVAVVTSPDNPSGRGTQQKFSAIKQYILSNNIDIPILQPKNLKSQDFIEELKSYNAYIQVVVSFRMMPESVWNMPPMGTINLHGSLLPKYRGAAPINWTIINGDTETGVTTFKLDKTIDTGNILMQKSISILPEDDFGTLHDKMMYIGANLLLDTVIVLSKGELHEIPQQHSMVTPAPKLFKENTIIDWANNCQYIHNFVRGLSPYPCAYTYLGRKLLKVFKTHYVIEKHDYLPMLIDTDNKTYLRFSCNNGWIYLNEVQLEGKKRMGIKDFLNGNRL